MMDWLDTEAAVAGFGFAKALIILAFAVVLGLVASRVAKRFSNKRFSPAQAEVAGRLAFWTCVALGVASGLREIGFDLSVLIGAAGLLTVALAFASQTSASNLISGLFLLFERPFAIGDVIRVGTITGEVVSIDLLSVRLRTFDNLLVRVPNETLLKSEITNLSHFPIRRFELPIGVHYRHDLDRVTDALVACADANPKVLDEPRPQVQFIGFQDSAVALQLTVWIAQEDWIQVKHEFPRSVHAWLRREEIEIPFPQRVVTMTE